MKFSKQLTKIALIAPPALLLTSLPIATFIYTYNSLGKLDRKIDSFIKSNNKGIGNSILDIFKSFFEGLADENPNDPEIKALKEKVKSILDNWEGNTPLTNLLNSLKKLETIIIEKAKINEEVKGLTERIKLLINQRDNISNEVNQVIDRIKKLINNPPNSIRSRSKSLWSNYILNKNFKETKASPPSVYYNEKKEIEEVGSTLSRVIIKEEYTGLQYIPYADIGIVIDSVEYFLKNKSFPDYFREKAKKLLQELGKAHKKNEDAYLINYNDLKEFKKYANKFNIGFMQNDISTDNLDPAWNAIPKEDANKSGEWFQKQRWDKWVTGENALDSKDLTITFGPFVNSFWHQAYLNNFTEFELADSFKELAKKYGTKSFDFYFAPPFNRNSPEYLGSTRLLAGALKILKEEDNEYKIRLSIVSPDNGVYITGITNGNDEFSKKNDGLANTNVGDDIRPVVEFTRFLGINFNLNLVTSYITNLGNIKGKALEKNLENTHKTWKSIIKYFSHSNKDLNDNIVWNKLSVTPWIGLRAEKPSHIFNPIDALKLRKFALEKQMHSISMFYITRDNPSKYIDNGNKTGDLNPLDQNIRSGLLYDSGLYSEIFQGKHDKKEITEEIYEKSIHDDEDGLFIEKKLEEVKGLFDFDKLVKDEKNQIINKELKKWREELDNLNKDEKENELTVGIGNEGNGRIGEELINKKNNLEFWGKHLSWYSANPLRWDLKENKAKNIENKWDSNNKTKYSPYVDMGLWPLVDYRDLKEKITKLNHLTLAFVQQNNSYDDKLDLTFAGYYSPTKGKNSINDDYLTTHLKPKILDQFKDKLNNLTISYGGFATGDNNKNPWHTALALKNGNIDEAAEMLANSIEDFNKNLSALADASKNEIYNVDFDIEGNARNKQEELKVLFKAMAILKDRESKWNFSLTLPVLPSGLVSNEVNAMLPSMLKIYAGFDKLKYEDLPTINIMAMDYGVGIYNTYLNMGKTNFDMAQLATTNTRNQYYQAIKNAGFDLSSKENSYEKIAVTPMIGVNDHKNGVFTLEDAKEFYNWVHSTTDLDWIGIWSINDDNPKNGDKNEMKSLTSHGLNYLRKYDFSKVFTGDWDDLIKKPKLYADGFPPNESDPNWFTNLKNLLYN